MAVEVAASFSGYLSESFWGRCARAVVVALFVKSPLDKLGIMMGCFQGQVPGPARRDGWAHGSWDSHCSRLGLEHLRHSFSQVSVEHFWSASHCSRCWQQERPKVLLMQVTEVRWCHPTGTDAANRTGENLGALVLSLTQIPRPGPAWLSQGFPSPYFPLERSSLKFPGMILSLFIQQIFVDISSDDNLFMKAIEGIRIGHVSNSA